jgi:hypothetical protein
MDDKTGKEDKEKCEECKMASPDEIRLAKGHLGEHARNFDALCVAAMSGRLGMGVCKDAKTGEKFCTLCVLIESKEGERDGVQIVPLARMIDGNPFDACAPPEAGVMVMPNVKELADLVRPKPTMPTPAKGGMLN